MFLMVFAAIWKPAAQYICAGKKIFGKKVGRTCMEIERLLYLHPAFEKGRSL
jgi:hypothetical protein